jgi:hypothetical protein
MIETNDNLGFEIPNHKPGWQGKRCIDSYVAAVNFQPFQVFSIHHGVVRSSRKLSSALVGSIPTSNLFLPTPNCN